MNLQQLETFHWIARLGSFTAAGNRLCIPQPTISMRVKELESELGVALIDRIGRGIRLTHQGRQLAVYAEQLVSLMGLIRQEFSDPAKMTGTVRMGVAELVAGAWLPELIRQINAHFPAIEIELSIELTETMIQQLDEGNLDLLLTPGPPRYPSHYLLHYLGSVELAFMAHPDLMPRQTLPVGPEQLCELALITIGSQSLLHDIEAAWFTQEHRPGRRIKVVNNMGIAAKLTMAGLGISLLPPQFYQPWIEQNQLAVIATNPPLPPLNFYAMSSRDDPHPLTAALIPIAQSVCTFQRSDTAPKINAV